jgi:hypothetical protein
MKRHTARYARISVLALGISILAAPIASAYPVRDVDPPCPSGAARTSVALLASRDARYFSLADFTIADSNANGVLCVIPLERRDAATVALAGPPPMFMDDRG